MTKPDSNTTAAQRPWWQRCAGIFTSFMLFEGVGRLLPGAAWWEQVPVCLVVFAIAELGFLGRIDLR